MQRPRSGEDHHLDTGAKITIRDIQKLVCGAFSVHGETLLSSCRESWIIPPRSIAIWLCYRYTSASTTAIGRKFNRKSSSVIRAIQRAEKFMDEDAILSAKISHLMKLIETP